MKSQQTDLEILGKYQNPNQGGKTMTTKKRIISFVLAVAMVLASIMIPAIPAKADGTKTITLTGVTHDDYNAYQIFKGTVSGTSPDLVLGDIEWGNGVDEVALVAKLKAASSSVKSYFSTVNDATPEADKVAKGLEAIKDESNVDELLKAFAAAVAGSVTSTKTAGVYNSGTGTTTFTGLDEGYYLVLDEATITDGADDANSSYIVQVVNSVTMQTKMKVPKLTKKIVEGSDRVDANAASIGDKVTYEIVTTVPDMRGYNKYFYVVNDTLDAGLTYDTSVPLKIVYNSETTLVEGTDYTLDVSGQNIEIVFLNFLTKYDGKQGKEFTITYNATVNENAVIGMVEAGNPTGNKNTASLKYTNNPTVEYTGDGNDKPGPGEPFGKTPDQVVRTYVYGIKLTKVNGDDTDELLTGAKFKIASTDASFISKINETIFRRNDSTGTYYRLKDGTYATSIGGATDCEDDDDTIKYEMVTGIKYSSIPTDIVVEGYVGTAGDDKGIITFKGLGDGTYDITELIAPEGYNKLTDPISVVISADYSDPASPSFQYGTGGVADTAVPEDGIIKVQVENYAGVVLPSTGGMGTTLFYVIGGVLVLVAGVLLITKKRMDRE